MGGSWGQGAGPQGRAWAGESVGRGDGSTLRGRPAPARRLTVHLDCPEGSDQTGSHGNRAAPWGEEDRPHLPTQSLEWKCIFQGSRGHRGGGGGRREWVPPSFPETLLRAERGQSKSPDLAESRLSTPIPAPTARTTRWRHPVLNEGCWCFQTASGNKRP